MATMCFYSCRSILDISMWVPLLPRRLSVTWVPGVRHFWMLDLTPGPQHAPVTWDEQSVYCAQWHQHSLVSFQGAEGLTMDISTPWAQ